MLDRFSVVSKGVGSCGSCSVPEGSRKEMNNSFPPNNIEKNLFVFRCLLCSYVCELSDSEGREHMNGVNSATVGMFATLPRVVNISIVRIARQWVLKLMGVNLKLRQICVDLIDGDTHKQ